MSKDGNSMPSGHSNLLSSQQKTFFQRGTPVFLFVPIAPGPFIELHWKGPGLRAFTHTMEISPECSQGQTAPGLSAVPFGELLLTSHNGFLVLHVPGNCSWDQVLPPLAEIKVTLTSLQFSGSFFLTFQAIGLTFSFLQPSVTPFNFHDFFKTVKSGMIIDF